MSHSRLAPILHGLVGLLLVTVWPSGLGLGQTQSVNPSINRPYESNSDYQRWIQIFERPGREVYDRRHAIVAALDLRPGMVVADIGAGTGLFTRLFAPQVMPGGQVLAVDIAPEFVENTVVRARQAGFHNVRGIINTPHEVTLGAQSIDLAFICDTYHHFEYPKPMMHSIEQALKPGGSVVVIDFRRIPGYSSAWVMNHVRAGKQTVIEEIEAVGLKFVEERDFLRTNYFLRFKKAP